MSFQLGLFSAAIVSPDCPGVWCVFESLRIPDSCLSPHVLHDQLVYVMSVCMSVCLSVCVSVHLCVCLFVCLSAYLCVYLSVCLSLSDTSCRSWVMKSLWWW